MRRKWSSRACAQPVSPVSPSARPLAQQHRSPGSPEPALPPQSHPGTLLTPAPFASSYPFATTRLSSPRMSDQNDIIEQIIKTWSLSAWQMPEPEGVSQMSTIQTPMSTTEALGMLRAAMGFLTTADAAQMMTEEQARCLQVLEQITSMGTAARTAILAAFTAGQGYAADGDYSTRAWLINRARVTKGAAVAYTAWMRRGAPP